MASICTTNSVVDDAIDTAAASSALLNSTVTADLQLFQQPAPVAVIPEPDYDSGTDQEPDPEDERQYHAAPAKCDWPSPAAKRQRVLAPSIAALSAAVSVDAAVVQFNEASTLVNSIYVLSSGPPLGSGSFGKVRLKQCINKVFHYAAM